MSLRGFDRLFFIEKEKKVSKGKFRNLKKLIYTNPHWPILVPTEPCNKLQYNSSVVQDCSSIQEHIAATTSVHIDPPLGSRPVHVFTKQFQPSNLPIRFTDTWYGSKFLTIKFTGTFYS